MQPDIINNRLRNNQDILKAINTPANNLSIVIIENPISVKRKQLELNLVREIEKAIAGGLDLHFIAVELRAGGTDVRVSLNEAAKTTDQTPNDHT